MTQRCPSPELCSPELSAGPESAESAQMQVYFKIEKNTLNRTIQNYIDTKIFNNSKALKMLSRDITIFYSKAFAANNV